MTFERHRTMQVPTAPPATGVVGDTKPRVLLMGNKRSGKSSITNVIFHKLNPSETLHLETTTHITKDAMQSFMDFQVWDFPGHINYLDPEYDSDSLFAGLGALVWVIDAQDNYSDAVDRLNTTALMLYERYRKVNVEVFVHKVDCLAVEDRDEISQRIQQKVLDELSDHGIDDAPIHFHQTSIFDYSVYEAFSKVLQKLIPQLSALEALLNGLCARSMMDKAYLFDVATKIYIAADTSPSGSGTYGMCADWLDLMVDIGEIYGYDHGDIKGEPPHDGGEQSAEGILNMGDGGPFLYLKEIDRYLALVAIMNKDAKEENQGAVNFNVNRFQEGVKQVFEQR